MIIAAIVLMFISLWNLTKSFNLFVRLKKLVDRSKLGSHTYLPTGQRDVGSVCSCVLEEWLWRKEKGHSFHLAAFKN